MKKFLPLILPVLLGCHAIRENQQSGDTSDLMTDSGTLPPVTTIPQHEYQITDGGIGSLLLGSDYSIVETEFPESERIRQSDESKVWHARLIRLTDKEWIMAESEDGLTITRLITNSRKYRTVNGHYIGERFNEILKSGEEAGIEVENHKLIVRLYNEGIALEVDSISEQQFCSSENQDLKDIPGDAKVAGFIVF